MVSGGPAETAGAATAHAEKREGAFYVFSAAEVDALMGEDADVVRRRFGVEPNGNAFADPQGSSAG